MCGHNSNRFEEIHWVDMEVTLLRIENVKIVDSIGIFRVFTIVAMVALVVLFLRELPPGKRTPSP